MTPLGNWLSVQEAVELTGYHPDHIRRLLRAGEIECRKWGNAWMVNRDSLSEYLKESQAQGEKRGPKSK